MSPDLVQCERCEKWLPPDEMGTSPDERVLCLDCAKREWEKQQ